MGSDSRDEQINAETQDVSAENERRLSNLSFSERCVAGRYDAVRLDSLWENSRGELVKSPKSD